MSATIYIPGDSGALAPKAIVARIRGAL